jgi:hypothetical protein
MRRCSSHVPVSLRSLNLVFSLLIMGVLQYAKILLTHPNEFRALVNYAVWRNPLRTLEDDPATSGWDREDMRRCWAFLDKTSRSFASVIKELEGDLARAVCLFLSRSPPLLLLFLHLVSPR